MVIIRAIEMVMGAVLILLSAVMFKWWLEADESILRLVQIALYGIIGIMIILDNWRGENERIKIIVAA